MIFSRKLRRAEVLRFFERTPPCRVAMEACGGSHYWAREIGALGHDVCLIPPVYVKPFVKRGKTDAADAEAISEAASRKTMRFVPVKTAEQQADAMMLKTRALLIGQRTQAINALRAHLSELGVVAGVGMGKVAALIEIVRDEADARLPKSARFALAELANQIEAFGASDRQARTRDRRRGEAGPGSAAADDDPRRRRDNSRIGESFRSGPRGVQIRSSLRGLAWFDAQTAFERRQRTLGRDIENGQRDVTLFPRSRCVVCSATHEKPRRRTAMADGTVSAPPFQDRRCGARQQNGADHMGVADQRWSLQKNRSQQGGGLNRREQMS